MRIGFIGNFGNGKNAFDGQRIKVNLYREILIREGFEIDCFNLEGNRVRLLRIWKAIKRLLKASEVLLLMASTSGSWVLSRMIYLANRKMKRPVVFSTIGIGPISGLIKGDKALAAVYERGYTERKFPKLLQRALSSFDSILLEQKDCVAIYEKSFGLHNCFYLPNFRDDGKTIEPSQHDTKETIDVVYFARLVREKGAMDLLKAIEKANNAGAQFRLSFYGSFGDHEFETEFMGELTSKKHSLYKGVADPGDAIAILSSFDLLCFPSRWREGMPGTVIESLLAGTPILANAFPQYDKILHEGENAFIYRAGDNPEKTLETALLDVWAKRDQLPCMRQRCIESAREFSYTNWRETFLSFFMVKS